MINPSESAVLAWTCLVRAHVAALGAIERALKAQDFPALEVYDVLLELERHGPLRPRDVQRHLLLAQYNLSRLIERMVQSGWVERQACAGDRRGQMVAITLEGRRLRAAMWPCYAAALQAALGERFSAAEALTLAELLDRIAVGRNSEGLPAVQDGEGSNGNETPLQPSESSTAGV